MTNDDVIALAGAGLGDELVIAKINAAETTAFDTSVTGLKALKAAGVSLPVMKAMIYPTSVRAVVAAAAPADPDLPESPHSKGVYVMADAADGQGHIKKLVFVDPKQVVRSGMVFYDFTAQLDGPHASLQIVDENPVFFAYAGEDVDSFEKAIKSLALVKLDVKKKVRELHIGGTNAKLDEGVQRAVTIVPFKPGIFKISLVRPLEPGEYAFYEAGTWQHGAMFQNGGGYLEFGVQDKVPGK